MIKKLPITRAENKIALPLILLYSSSFTIYSSSYNAGIILSSKVDAIFLYLLSNKIFSFLPLSNGDPDTTSSLFMSINFCVKDLARFL